jgi:hypothetical protein
LCFGHPRDAPRPVRGGRRVRVAHVDPRGPGPVRREIDLEVDDHLVRMPSYKADTSIRVVFDDGPDDVGRAGLRRGEHGLRLGHAGHRVQHGRVPARQPVLLAFGAKQRKHFLGMRADVLAVRADEAGRLEVLVHGGLHG